MNKKPNILLIVTDHHAFFGHNRPGEYEIPCPRWREFCADGVTFDRAYSVSPICTPARASIMSGVYPSKHGLLWNTENQSIDNRRDFSQGTQLYSHYLSRQGYRNAYVGKWHCGHERIPSDYGIEGWSLPDYGKVYMSDAYKRYADARGLGEARAVVEHCTDNPEFEGETLTLHNPSPWHFMGCSGTLLGPPEAHEQSFVSQLAIEKLRELAGQDQPFSLVASYWGPHEPYFPSEPYASMLNPADIPEYPSFRDDLSGRPFRYRVHRDMVCKNTKRWTWRDWQEILAKCYGQMVQTDHEIGRLLDELDKLGIAENTMVIWTSDHGDALASHGGLWDKHSTYIEEVARVPLAIRWPGELDKGRATGALVNNMDITASMLSAAGAEVPAYFDSRSLLPLCEDSGDTDWPDYVVCEHHGHSEDTMFPQRIVVCRNHKYVATCFDGDELYDLQADPFETDNLIDSPSGAGLLKDLRLLLRRHLEKNQDTVAKTLAFKLKILTTDAEAN